MDADRFDQLTRTWGMAAPPGAGCRRDARRRARLGSGRDDWRPNVALAAAGTPPPAPPVAWSSWATSTLVAMSATSSRSGTRTARCGSMVATCPTRPLSTSRPTAARPLATPAAGPATSPVATRVALGRTAAATPARPGITAATGVVEPAFRTATLAGRAGVTTAWPERDRTRAMRGMRCYGRLLAIRSKRRSFRCVVG